MFKTLKIKTKYILPLVLSILSVFVASISTAAWFQLNQAPIQTSTVTGSSNITVNNGSVYGYKINQGIGDTGFVNYDSEDVAKFAATGINGTNHHQDSSDTNFNVPSGGIGYYLVQKNPGGTFKYKYTDDGGETYTSYSKKFIEMGSTMTLSSGTTTRNNNRAYVSSITVTASDVTNGTNVFRVMHYTFNNSKTVNVQLKIYGNDNSTRDDPSDDTIYAMGGNATVDFDTNDVIVAAGTYKVWLDYGQTVSTKAYGFISFEDRNSSANFPTRADLASPRRAAEAITTKTDTNVKVTRLIVKDYVGGDFSVFSIEYIDFKFLNGHQYTHSDFAAFLTGEYGVEKTFDLENHDEKEETYNSWSHSDTNEKYLICLSQNSISGGKEILLDLPEWVNEVQFKFVRRNGYNWYPGSNHRVYSGSGYLKQIVYKVYDSSGWQCQCESIGSDDVTKTGAWGTATITKHARFSTSGDIDGAETETQTVTKYYAFNQPTTLSSVPANYTFVSAWYSDSSLSTNISISPIFVVGNTNVYAKYNANVTLVGSIFISTDGTNYYQYSTIDLSSTNKAYNTTYSLPSYESQNIADDSTGLYASSSNVTRYNGTNYWYTTAACTTTATTTGSYKVTAPVTLYARFNVDISSYKTFYVDISSCYEKTYNYYWSKVQARGTDGSTKYVDAVQVANKLYRLTLPCGNNGWDFKLGDGNSNNNNHDRCVQFSTSGCTTSGVSLLYLFEGNNGSEHTWGWQNPASSANYGTAKIRISTNGSTWVDPITGSSTITTQMEIGDGSSNNYFIYEHGLQIPSGYYVDVVVSDSSGTPANGSYGLVSNNRYYNPSGRDYISTSGTYIKTNVYSGNARFNFYIDKNGKLSITMVPDYGNGFFIMPYSTHGTKNFIDSIKMTTNSNTKATYEGFYATLNYKIFIRSYLDAVDTPIRTLASGVNCEIDNSSEISADTKNEVAAVIKFTSPGYYTIVVDNGNITVTSYSIDTSFKLNKLDTSKVDSAYKIWQQKTSLVLEVPFTCVNTYYSRMTLNVQNSLSAYVGVSLYVSDHQISSSSTEATDPYHFMRGTNYLTRTTYYNKLSSGTTITDQANATVKSASASDYYYAYILIDYLPTQTNTAGYSDASSTSLVNNSAYTGSVCTSGVYSTSAFTSDNLSSYLAFYLIAEQI